MESLCNDQKADCKKENIVNQGLLSLFKCHVVKFILFILTSLSNLEVVQQLSSELPKP